MIKNIRLGVFTLLGLGLILSFGSFVSAEEKYEEEITQSFYNSFEAKNIVDRGDVIRQEPTKEDIVGYITKLWGGKAQEALKIVSCENSTMDMARVNKNRDKTKDFGPFQINTIHIKRFGDGFTKDIFENIRVAHTMWKEQNWRPWYSSNSCHGLAYT